MKNPHLSILAVLVLLPFAAQADTFVLKNGDKLEGDLIREDKDSYWVEVHLAPTIRDERVVPKSDVVRIVKPEAGLAEFAQLQDLVPAPDGLVVGEYKQRIDLLTQFIEGFPSSSKVRKAMEIRVELRDELRQVEEGAQKVDGVLYPATELSENEFELDARKEARKIKQLINANQHLEALRAYTQFQTDYAYTQVHLDLVPLIQNLISSQSFQASKWLDTLKFRSEERIKGLERMTPGDRRDSERAIELEDENLRRRFRAETAAQAGWVTLHPFCKEALEYTVQYAKSELRKIDSLISKEFVDCGKLFRELYQMQKQGADEKVMREKIRIMQKMRVPKHYLDKFPLASGGR